MLLLIQVVVAVVVAVNIVMVISILFYYPKTVGNNLGRSRDVSHNHVGCGTLDPTLKHQLPMSMCLDAGRRILHAQQPP